MTIYCGRGGSVIKSDDTISWSIACTLAGATEIRRVFCATSGKVFASAFCTEPGLYEISTGTPVKVLTMDTNTCIWGMDEDADGNLYAGEYSTSSAGKMQIWKSSDGENWTQVYINDLGGASQDHIHDLRVDPATGWIYATIGDPTNDNIIRSKDGGTIWAVIQSGGAQLVGIAFGHGYIYTGTDQTPGNNKIYRFQDDGGASITLEEIFDLPAGTDNPIYCAGEYGNKVFFGCSLEHDANSSFFVFDGSEWTELYTATLTHIYISRHDYNGKFILSNSVGAGIWFTP